MYKYLLTVEMRVQHKDNTRWEYSGVVDLYFKIRTWEDINRVVEFIFNERHELLKYKEEMEHSTLKVICLEEL